MEIVLEYILCFFELLILYFLLSKFVYSKYNFRVVILIIAIFAFLELIVSVFVHHEIANFIYPFVIFIFGLNCFYDSKQKILIITLIFYVFEGILSILSINLFGIIMGDKTNLMLNMSNNRYLLGFLNKLLSAIPLLFIRKMNFIYAIPKINKRYMLILFLSIISIIICVFIGYDISLQVLTIQVKEMLLLFIIILSFTLFAGLVLTIIHIKTVNCLNEAVLEKNNSTLMDVWYQEIKNNQNEISSIRHGIKNTLQSIRTLLNDDDKDGAIEIIDEVTNSKEMSKIISWTNNILFDSIVYSKVVSSDYINFTVAKGVIPDYLKNIDVSLLFSNLIDNAIEAASKSEDKNIKIEFDYSQLGYIIKITNSSDEKNIDFLKTSKTDKKQHGFGYKIINNIIEKYRGQIVYKTMPKFVEVLIHFPMNYEE